MDIPLRRASCLRLVCALAVLVASGTARAQVSHPYPGVTLVRGSNTSLAVVNLCQPGIGMRATRFDERQATAPEWAARSGVDVAINGDYFLYGSYYVLHRARGAGADWPGGAQLNGGDAAYVEFGNRVADLRFAGGEPTAGATDIVGGGNQMITDGRIIYDWGPDSTGFLYGGHQRTCIGFSADRRTFYMMAVGQSVSIPRAAELMVDAQRTAGAPAIDQALNLDGGGSTQMYVSGLGAVVSSTRQVANHLGVFFGGGGVDACPHDNECPLGGVRDVCLADGSLGHCDNGSITSRRACDLGCHRLTDPADDVCWQAPRGSLDGAGCDRITGWAQDPNTPASSNDVLLAIDAPLATATRTMRVTADTHRDDLCTALGSCNHGFSFVTPMDLRDGRTHGVYAYATAPSGAPSQPLLGGSPRSFRCPVVLAGDFDADGRADVLQYDSTWQSIPVCASTGVGWSCRNLPAHLGASDDSAIVPDAIPLLMAFDHGRTADLVQIHGDADAPVCVSTGAGWSCSHAPLASANNVFDLAPGDPLAGHDGTALTADFNRDGRGDLIFFRNDAAAIPVCLSTGTGWSCRNLRANYVGGIGAGFQGSAVYNGTPFTGDFDGDGYADLVQFANGWQSIPMCRSTGAGWSCRNLYAYRTGGDLGPGNAGSGIWPGTRAIVGDFDGDGRDDVAQFRDDGSDALPVCLSLETGWSCRGLRALGSGLHDARDASATPGAPGCTPLVADLDGDGHDEIVLYDPRRSSIPVCRFDQGWSCRDLVASYAGGVHAGNGGSGVYDVAAPLTGDFDGDGHTDLAQFQPHGWTDIPVCVFNGTAWSCHDPRAYYAGGLGAGNGGSGIFD